MMRIRRAGWLVVLTLVAAGSLGAQEMVRRSQPESPTKEEPGSVARAAALRLLRFSGVLRDALGQPRTNTVGVTFALYKEQNGGAPLWLETQNIEPDADGHYTVLLGALQSEGLPLEIFTSEEARWLGLQVQGEEEQARILLVSVPYALKAADAERLGGKPASAYLAVEPSEETTSGTDTTSGKTAMLSGTGGSPPPAVTSGTAGRIAQFINTTDLGDSDMLQVGTDIGVGTTAPFGKFHVQKTGALTKLVVGNPNPVGNNAADGYIQLFGEHNGVVKTAFIQNIGDSLQFNGGATGVNIQFVGANETSVLNGTSLGLYDTTNVKRVYIRHDGARGLISTFGTGSAGIAIRPAADVTTAFQVIRSAAAGQTPIMTVDSVNSRVGIGTVSPAQALDVVGTVNATSGAFSGSVTAAGLSIDSPTLVVDAVNNRLGIGTATPTTALDVVGTVNATAFTGNGAGLTNVGDITAVNTAAGSGLSGGVATGAANLTLLTTCASGQLLKWNGVSWACADDTGGGGGAGDITAVNTGASSGLTGGVASGDANLSLLTTCATNQLLRWSGTAWVCTGDYAKLASSNTFTASNTFTSGTFSGTVTAGGLSVDSPTLVVDAVNNRVGIARAVPDESLHVGTGCTTPPSQGGICPNGAIVKIGTTEFIEDGGAFLVNVSPNDLEAFSLFADVDATINNNALVKRTLTVGTSATTGNNFTVINGTKSAAVRLSDNRLVKLYAMESPENWFEDFGGAALRSGVAWVPLDPAFAQTVNTNLDYRVFLTPNGDCRGLYVSRKTPAGFEVRELGGGTSTISFDFRIVAKRRGFESVRLEPMTEEAAEKPKFVGSEEQILQQRRQYLLSQPRLPSRTRQ